MRRILLVMALVGCDRSPTAAPAPTRLPSVVPTPAIDASIAPPIDAPIDAAIDAAIDAPIDAPIDAGGTFEHEVLGPLHQEMTVAALEAVLGKPKIRARPVKEEAFGTYAVTWTYPGVSLAMRGSGPNGPWWLGNITVAAPSTYATRAGIHVGSTVAEVQRAYPTMRTTASTEPTDPSAPTEPTELAVGADAPGGAGIVFAVVHGKVSAITIGVFGF